MTTRFRTASHEATREGAGAPEARIAADYVRQRVGAAFQAPVCGIVLGSGLGGLAAQVQQATRIPFAHVPGFPAATVAGHAGQLILGTLAGRPVAMLAGRFHMYEGHSATVAAFPVRVLHALGAPVYLASNAAGGVRRTFVPGDLMLLADHLNLMYRNPLTGPLEAGDERFPDMSDPYDRAPATADAGCGARRRSHAAGWRVLRIAGADLRNTGGSAHAGAPRRRCGGHVDRARGDGGARHRHARRGRVMHHQQGGGPVTADR